MNSYKNLNFTKSNESMAVMKKYITSGTNSPGRLFNDVQTPPLVIKKAHGSKIEDVDGNEYTDFLMGLGPNILGHCPGQVKEAIIEQASKGLVYGINNELEAELAKRIVESSNYVDEIRFTCSGTEAVMTAIRVARAHTGNPSILKFQGGYHGHADSLLSHMAKNTIRNNPMSVKDGIPNAVREDTLISKYNDINMAIKMITQYKSQLAAVIIEPIATNMGLIPPSIEFLSKLRELCTEFGIILIFDEVVSGYRFCFGPVSNRLGIKPDLTTYGKIIGGGLPVGAYGGRSDLMEQVGQKGGVFQGGSFAGNPITMAAGIATLDLLANPGFYEKITELASLFKKITIEGFEKYSIPYSIQQYGSLVTYIFNDERKSMSSFDDVLLQDNEVFAKFHIEMANRGFLFAPTIEEPIFIGSAHTKDDIEKAATTAVQVLNEILNKK